MQLGRPVERLNQEYLISNKIFRNELAVQEVPPRKPSTLLWLVYQLLLKLYYMLYFSLRRI